MANAQAVLDSLRQNPAAVVGLPLTLSARNHEAEERKQLKVYSARKKAKEIVLDDDVDDVDDAEHDVDTSSPAAKRKYVTYVNFLPCLT